MNIIPHPFRGYAASLRTIGSLTPLVSTVRPRPARQFHWGLAWLGLGLLGTFHSPESARASQPTFALPDNPPIRVLLMDSTTTAALNAGGAWQIRNANGHPVAALKAAEETTLVLRGERILIERFPVPGRRAANRSPTGPLTETDLGPGPLTLSAVDPETTLMVRQVPYGVGWWWEKAENRIYEGEIELRANTKGKLSLVETLPLEKYLRGVVPSEIGMDSPHEAYCAQAVTARSAAVLALTSRIYAGDNYDICSDVACQAYSGLTKANAVADAAIVATRGMILEFEGRPVSAYYASNCGGFSEDIRNVWADRADDQAYWNTAQVDGETTVGTPDLTTEAGLKKWIESAPDVWCNPAFGKIPTWAAKNFRWKLEFSAETMTKFVEAKKPGVGRIKAIRAVKRGPSGRMIEAEFVGESGTLKLGPELAIRQVFVPPTRSAAFFVETTGPEDLPTTFTIRGGGWGHGVGMCQSGAVAMSRADRKHPEILKHYYPRAALINAYKR